MNLSSRTGLSKSLISFLVKTKVIKFQRESLYNCTAFLLLALEVWLQVHCKRHPEPAGVWAPGHTLTSAHWATGAGGGTQLLPPTLCGNCDPALLPGRPFPTLTGTLRRHLANYGQSAANQEHTDKEQLPNLLVSLHELPKDSTPGTGSSLPRIRNYLDLPDRLCLILNSPHREGGRKKAFESYLLW